MRDEPDGEEDTFLADWRTDPDRMPMIILGAPQIGKTESVLQFVRETSDSAIKGIFARYERYRSIIAADLA